MIRLFVAIRPPAAIRSALLSIMGGIEGARWQNDDQLHITLRFIGKVDEHQAEDVTAALAGLTYPSFEVGIDGVGSFTKKSRDQAVWAKVMPRAAISMLAAKIERACQRAGLPPGHQAYLPHITLARFGRMAGPIEPFMESHAGLALPAFAVDHFALFQSDLGHGGANYTMLQRYPLG